MTDQIQHVDGSVTITNKEIYSELMQVKGAVQTMGGQGGQIIDHETRIRGLEKWRYALPPTLLVALASLVIALLGGTRG